MAKTIASFNGLKIIQTGINLKDCWFDVYQNEIHKYGCMNAGDAFQFALNLAGIGDVPID